jgi:hypothetical protein
MLTRRRLFEVKHGKDALLHRIGEDYRLSHQLPNPFGFSEPDEPRQTAPDNVRSGIALAESFLKLIQASSEPDKANWLADYVDSMPSRDMRFGFLCHIENMLQVSLLRPKNLPTVAARLDSLGNLKLQEQVTQAYCWEPIGERPDGTPIFFGDDDGIYSGLLEDEVIAGGDEYPGLDAAVKAMIEEFAEADAVDKENT